MSSCQKNMSTCLLVKSISSRPVYLSSCQKDLSPCLLVKKHKQPTRLPVFLSKKHVFMSENNITNLQQYGKKKLGARGGL